MFKNPGKAFYYLNDVKVDGASDSGTDFIQFFKPGTTTLDRDQSYYFDGDVWCYKYDAADGESWEEDEEIPENFQVPNELGFITRFGSAKAANSIITYAGEVQQGDGETVDVPRVSAYQVVVNPLPFDVDLTKLLVESASDSGTDFIQFFKPGTTSLDRDQSYYFDGDVWCYKYDATDGESWEEDEEVPEGKCIIKPGEGFLIRFGSAKAVNAKIIFPAPLAKDEE